MEAEAEVRAAFEQKPKTKPMVQLHAMGTQLQRTSNTTSSTTTTTQTLSDNRYSVKCNTNKPVWQNLHVTNVAAVFKTDILTSHRPPLHTSTPNRTCPLLAIRL